MPTSPSGSSKEGFVSAVRRTLTAHRMLAPGDSVLVAVSGGPDSTALLHALARIGEEKPLALAAAHLHHGLRGAEADRDADFAARQAESMGLDFFCERLDVDGYRRRLRLSTEEAARRLRYHALVRIADQRGCAKIALGHHADDSAESMLLFLLRGAGPRGLSGIAPRRGRFIRPLIDQRRADIGAFLECCGIPFVNDTTNTDTRFLRNRIRHELIPQLAADYNPNLIETLLRLSAVLRAEDRWLDALAEERFAEALLSRETEAIVFSVPRLAALPAAACRRVLRKAVAELAGDLRRIGFRHVEDVRRLLLKTKGAGALDLPRGLQATRTYERLKIHRSPRSDTEAPTGFTVFIDGPGEVRIPGRGQVLRMTSGGPVDAARIARSGHRVAFFDMGRLYFPLKVRNVRPGDRFRPLGMNGTQKISDFFVNRKVPRPLRSACPVLVSGGKIAWVIGYRMAEDFRATPDTRRTLRAELLAEADSMLSIRPSGGASSDADAL